MIETEPQHPLPASPACWFRAVAAIAATVMLTGVAAPSHAANWSVTRVNHATLAPPGGVTVAEMSGVTYLGPSAGGQRFLAAEETKGELVQFDLSINASGGITAASGVAAVPIDFAFDFEGIAFTNASRNSVFLADETAPRVREIDLATGGLMQLVPVPAVFPANKRPNLGFESLARTLDATVMWTANEQALTVDGGIATPTAGTTVRLLKMNVAGNTVTNGPQFAYTVEPIHGTSTVGSPQSGLSDLVAMPDGTLLALERSVAFTTLLYLNRIYEVDAAGATDVGVGALAGGLDGQAFTPVGKELLWSGAADGASGQNLEGLTLGPRLANGDWLLIGVVDNQNGADFVSGNTVVAFVASAIETADFDADGDVDGADFLAQQRGLGKSLGATLAEGDADRDGDVDATDFNIWKAAAATPASQSIPEPATAWLLVLGALSALARAAKKP